MSNPRLFPVIFNGQVKKLESLIKQFKESELPKDAKAIRSLVTKMSQNPSVYDSKLFAKVVRLMTDKLLLRAYL